MNPFRPVGACLIYYARSQGVALGYHLEGRWPGIANHQNGHSARNRKSPVGTESECWLLAALNL